MSPGHGSAGIAAAMVAALAIIAYANSLQAGFSFDDEPVIQDNPAVTRPVDLIGILAAPLYPGDLYRPFTVLTFALNEHFAPGNAAAYHAVNVLLHALVTVLVFLLALRLFISVRLAAVAGVLFALHPIHTEAVTSSVGRAELLAAVFSLAAMLVFLAADDIPVRGRQMLLRLGAVGLCALGVLCKESAVAAIPLIFLCRVAHRGESLSEGLRREARALDWAPYGVMIGTYLLLRWQIVGAARVTTVLPIDNPLAFVPGAVRIRSAFGVLWDYFGLLNLPLMLSADYSYDQVPIVKAWWDPRCMAGIGIMVVAGYVLLRGRGGALSFAVVWPFVALSLTANFLFPIGTVKAERLLYFPSVGWVLLLAYICDRFLCLRRYAAAVWIVLVLVSTGFAVRTWMRNWDWHDNATLCRSMARSAPNSAKAHYNLGLTFQREGTHAAARREFERALSIYPWAGGANAAFGIGVSFDQEGRVHDAIEPYRKALELEPGFQKAHTNLCRALWIEARFDEAMVACRQGLRYAPADPNLLKGLGESLVSSGDVAKGAAVLRRSLALNPSDRQLRTQIAEISRADAGAQQRAAALP